VVLQVMSAHQNYMLVELINLSDFEKEED